MYNFRFNFGRFDANVFHLFVEMTEITSRR